MKKRAFSILFLLVFALTGCRKPLTHPEDVDPVYRDLKSEANKAIGEYKAKEKASLEAKKAFEAAPIRTGQRLAAQDLYFKTRNEQQRLAERYRYFTLKADLRRKRDILTYPNYFKDKMAWPDLAEYEQYQVEKRLANAPREWNPENRVKERALASEKRAKPAETREGE